jgi:hypothetical protein
VLALVLAGALLIIAAIGRSHGAASQPVCKTGDRELASGYVQAAAQTYEKGRTHSNANCVVAGLRKTVRGLCDLGDAFVHSGLYAKAESTYEQALAARPTSTCPRAGIRHVAAGRCQLAARLARQGRSEEANKLRESIPAEDGVVCANERDLARLSRGSSRVNR